MVQGLPVLVRHCALLVKALSILIAGRLINIQKPHTENHQCLGVACTCRWAIGRSATLRFLDWWVVLPPENLYIKRGAQTNWSLNAAANERWIFWAARFFFGDIFQISWPTGRRLLSTLVMKKMSFIRENHTNAFWIICIINMYIYCKKVLFLIISMADKTWCYKFGTP